MSYLFDYLVATYHFLVNSWGLILALAGYLVQKFFVPQILDFKEILKRARYDVIYYANIFPITDKNGKLINHDEIKQASKELRIMGARIRAHRDNIPFYNYVARTKLIPKFEDTENAATGFIGWSNELYETQQGVSARQLHRKEIAKALGMKHY